MKALEGLEWSAMMFCRLFRTDKVELFYFFVFLVDWGLKEKVLDLK